MHAQPLLNPTQLHPALLSSTRPYSALLGPTRSHSALLTGLGVAVPWCSESRIAGGAPVFVLYLTCFLLCPRLRFGFLVLLTTFPPDTANRCVHPALRPSTSPSVVLDCTDFRHCGQRYVRSIGELCDLAILHCESVSTSLFATVDLSVRNAGLH